MNPEQKNKSFAKLMTTVFLGTFAVMLSSSMMNIALPFFMTHFHTNLDNVKWTMTGFMLAMGTTAALTAYLGERFSYKKLYIYANLGFLAASIFALFSMNIYWLIGARILQGAFGGVIVPATMAIIYQVIPSEKQVVAISIWNIAPMLAPALGPTASGFLIQYFEWKALFLINVIFSLITILLAIKYLPMYKLDDDIHLDSLGLGLSLLSSLTLLIAFSEGAIIGWTAPLILSLMVIGAISLGCFIYHELHTQMPALDLRVFKYSQFTYGLMIIVCINVSLYAGSLILPIFLQNVQGYSAFNAGLVLFIPSILMSVSMPFTGRLVNHLGVKAIITVGLLMIAIGTFAVSHLSIGTTANYLIFWSSIRYTGLAIASMPANYISIAVLPKEVAGHASSISNWIKQIFSCLAIGVFSSLMTVRVATHFKIIHATSSDSLKLQNLHASVMGINDVFAISAIIILCGLPFALLLHKKNAK